MKAIAKAVNCQWDGDDNRIHANETLHVDISDMSEAEYDAMEEDINGYEVQGQGFTVYAWNDSSGYAYWRKDDGMNYIQVTALVEPDDVDVLQLKRAIQAAIDHFARYAVN